MAHLTPAPAPAMAPPQALDRPPGDFNVHAPPQHLHAPQPLHGQPARAEPCSGQRLLEHHAGAPPSARDPYRHRNPQYHSSHQSHQVHHEAGGPSQKKPEGMPDRYLERPPPQYFTRRDGRFTLPKKWRVVRSNTVVRATQSLDSDQVQQLKEGEIVEQVEPRVTLRTGVIRLLIRHPSSPRFPDPIGWVTLDATAAGGPIFLEPGPEAMSGIVLPWTRETLAWNSESHPSALAQTGAETQGTNSVGQSGSHADAIGNEGKTPVNASLSSAALPGAGP